MLERLSIYLLQYKRYFLISPIFVFLDVLCELSMPLLMARIIDIGVANQDVAYITRTGLYMILLAFAAIGFGMLNMKFTAMGGMGFGANLRAALFEKVQSFSFTNIDHFSTASLVTRLTNDVNNIQMTVMIAMRMLLRAPFMLVIAFILAFNINARLSLILAVAIPLLAVAVWFIIRTATALFATMQEKIDTINRTIQENLIGIRVVKSFVREKHEIHKFQAANDDLTHAAIRASNIVILNMPVMFLVINAATLAIIWNGGRMVYSRTLGAGQLIGFISYVFMILFSVMMISFVIVLSARAQASGKRILEVLDTHVDIQDEPSLVSDSGQTQNQSVRIGKVEFRNVSFRYDLTGTGENVLSDINFVADPGQIIAIVGGTGTGKSTLVNLIPRLYEASTGSVLVDDIDVRNYKLENLRAGIGVVLQNNSLFSGTIKDNLTWGNGQATLSEIENAAKISQSHDFVMEFTEGYNTELAQGAVNLSGGQKQRLSIARALLKKPKILILDDSTSSVDSATEKRIRAALRELEHNLTVFIIAQRISSIRDADKIIVLDDGKIVGIGTHSDLIKSNPVYQEINESQQEGVLANG